MAILSHGWLLIDRFFQSPENLTNRTKQSASDGRWEGRYTIGRDAETGKLLYRNVLAKTQAECKAKLREAIRNVQQADGPAPAKPAVHYTVGEWLRTWFELYSKPNLRETTQEQYTNFLEKHLIPNIGNIPLNRLTSLRLQTLYQEFRTSGRVNTNKKAGPGLILITK